MPIYEFRCGACDERFERIQSMSVGAPACPSCGGAEVTREISLIAGLGGGEVGGGMGGCPCGGACACGSRN